MGNPNQDLYINIPMQAQTNDNDGVGIVKTTMPETKIESNANKVQRSGSTAGGGNSEMMYKDMIFPQRLMKILSEGDNSDAITWMPDGQAFVVADRNLFTETVMPKFFPRKSKFSSFVRKLNRWGFIRIPNGPNAGAYYNEFFRKDKPHLAARMFYQHKRTKATSSSALSLNSGGSSNNLMHESFGSSLAGSSFGSRSSFASIQNSFGSGLSLSAFLSANSLSSFGGGNSSNAIPSRGGHNANWDLQPNQVFGGAGGRGGSGQSYGQTQMKPMEIHQRLLAACGVNPGLAENEQQQASNNTRNSTAHFRAAVSQPNLISQMNQQQQLHNSNMNKQPQMEASIFNNLLTQSSSSQGLLSPNNINLNGPANDFITNKMNNAMFQQRSTSANDLAALLQPNSFPFQSSIIEDNANTNANVQQQQQQQKMNKLNLMLLMQQMKNGGGGSS